MFLKLQAFHETMNSIYEFYQSNVECFIMRSLLQIITVTKQCDKNTPLFNWKPASVLRGEGSHLWKETCILKDLMDAPLCFGWSLTHFGSHTHWVVCRPTNPLPTFSGWKSTNHGEGFAMENSGVLTDCRGLLWARDVLCNISSVANDISGQESWGLLLNSMIGSGKQCSVSCWKKAT